MSKKKFKKVWHWWTSIEHHCQMEFFQATYTSNFKLEYQLRHQHVSEKMLLIGPKFQAKTPCCSRVFILAEWHKYTLPRSMKH